MTNLLCKIRPWKIIFKVLEKSPSLVPSPHSIELEVSTKCNLKCRMCEHTYWDEPGKDLSYEDFKKIVEQFPRLNFVGFSGIGSNFLNKDFLKMLRYLKSKSVFVEIFDPFYLVDEKAAKELVDLSIDLMWMSVDGATKETYEDLRVGSDFDRVINNVKNLIRLKKEMGKELPEIRFHYIVLKPNLHEMEKFVELIHSIADGETPMIQFSQLLHPFEEVKDLAADVPEDIKRRVNEKGKELGIDICWNEYQFREKPPIKNCYNWTMPYIYADGTVQPCCALQEQKDRPFLRKYSIGNVMEKPFTEIWKDEHKKFRQMIHNNRVPPICTRCQIYDVGSK